MNLVEEYKNDRKITKVMVRSTFERDNVPEELIEPYFEAYDLETEHGIKIAEWLDSNRPTEAEISNTDEPTV